MLSGSLAYPFPCSRRVSSAAFTLLELLVVIGIIIALVSIGVPVMNKVKERQKVRQAEAEIDVIQSAIEKFQQDFGNSPSPKVFEKYLERELTSEEKQYNLGNEVLVACLYSELPSKLKKEPYLSLALTGGEGENLVDTDGDGLKELPDPWGSPYIYFDHTEYVDAYEQEYNIEPNESGDRYAAPKRDASQNYYRQGDWQLWSCGPNKANDTNCSETVGTAKDDDIRNWTLK